MCIADKFHCILKTYELAKSLRKGCMEGPRGLDLPDGPSMNGKPQKDLTEVTGQLDIRGNLYDADEDGDQIWNITNLSLKMEDAKLAQKLGWSHITADGFRFEPNSGEWEGWMWVGVLKEHESTAEPKIQWVEIRRDHLKTFDKPGGTVDINEGTLDL